MIQDQLGRARVAQLARTDNYRNLLYIAFDWVSIAVVVVVSINLGGLLAYLVAIGWVGSRQRALINLVHQASHRQLFANPKLNLWMGRLFGSFPLLLCVGPYQRHHLRHHGHLWEGETDPKSEWYHVMDLSSGAGNALRFLGHSIARLGLHTAMNLRDALAWHQATRGELIAIAVFWCVVAAVSIALGIGWVVLLYWFVPYLTVFQVIRYVTTASDHAGLESANPWLATRTWNAGPLVRWLIAPHSDSYHLAHHLVPSVPHYRLAELHRNLMQVPEYAAGHHCDGLILPRRADAPSVLRDICRPDEIGNYKRMPAAFVGVSNATS